MITDLLTALHETSKILSQRYNFQPLVLLAAVFSPVRKILDETLRFFRNYSLQGISYTKDWFLKKEKNSTQYISVMLWNQYFGCGLVILVCVSEFGFINFLFNVLYLLSWPGPTLGPRLLWRQHRSSPQRIQADLIGWSLLKKTG